MPDKVVPVSEVEGESVEQVIVGSCTNGGYEDILPVAKMLEGRETSMETETIVAPGSKQASEMLAREGWVAEMMAAGVQLLRGDVWCLYRHRSRPLLRTPSRCEPSTATSRGRSGIEDDNVYLCSPEVAAAASLKGEIVDPRNLADELGDPRPPASSSRRVMTAPRRTSSPRRGRRRRKLIKGPNIGDVPLKDQLGTDIAGEALLKMEDNITTDHIIPCDAGHPDVPVERPQAPEFTLSRVDDTFADRALGGRRRLPRRRRELRTGLLA